MSDAPALRLVHGEVAAISQDQNTVTLLIDGEYCDYSYSPRALADALELEKADEPWVQAVVLRRPNETPRILRIDPEGTEYGGTPEQRWEYISKRWDNVLRELAG